MKLISGNLVDIHKQKIYPAEITIENGQILEIRPSAYSFSNYIVPGFIDAHVHIESSMLIPSEFAKVAVTHGTVATVSDPHEIANVLGIDGVNFMIENGKSVPFKFNWCAPSCVPATIFETAGGSISCENIESLFQNNSVVALAEMMNFPGVIFKDMEVVQKLELAKKHRKPIDGHAPGLRGAQLDTYIAAGISTDHECTTLAEALEKLKMGMKILIRNGSSAKNFDALYTLLNSHPNQVMLCCDDISASDLLHGHMNYILRLGIKQNVSLFNLLRACSLNVIEHYGLACGCLRVGDPADFCIVGDLKELTVLETWIDGNCVFEKKSVTFSSNENILPINLFNALPISNSDIQIPNLKKDFNVIEAKDGDLLTSISIVKNTSSETFLNNDISNDILKLVVVNRYTQANPAVAFIRNFGLKYGAMACSIAHDSHNIIAVGASDLDLVQAINELIELKGGLIVYTGSNFIKLSLPFGGLMTNNSADVVSETYRRMKESLNEMGSTLTSPFMTLSFMALLVIPQLKLSDKGLFDGSKFEFTPLFV